jgi:mono/diheme cytochrome c family protein
MNGAGMGPVSDAPPDLYAYYCSGCHGVQGAGMETYGPETQHPVHDYSLWVVRNGLPGEGYRDPMEPLEASVLSDAALESIFDWLDEPPQPTTGEGLYLDYCGNCHGADGKGGPTMRPILQELAEIEPLVRQGAHLGEFAMRREYMPAWNTMQLSDAEVDLIYAYVESL